MGSPFKIAVYADNPEVLEAAVSRAYLRVDTLNAIFSDYAETSEISVLTKNYKKGEWVHVSSKL